MKTDHLRAEGVGAGGSSARKEPSAGVTNVSMEEVKKESIFPDIH